MTQSQALDILQPEGSTLDDLKTAYRKAALKYHPDRNPNGLEMMKLVNAAFELLKAFVGGWRAKGGKAGSSTIMDDIQEILNAIRHFKDIQAEVIGTWLWITGETRPYRSRLEELGLKYSAKKDAWFWKPPGDFVKTTDVSYSMDDLRSFYRVKRARLEPDKDQKKM